MRRHKKRVRSAYRPYQGRRGKNGWIFLAVLLALALALALWLWRDALILPLIK